MSYRETLSFEAAWSGYLKWAHRLPEAPPPVEPRRVSGLAEIVEAFDAVILDNFGVLSLGAPVIPAGKTAYDLIRSRGLAVRVISNDGSKDLRAMAARHQARGYHFAPEEIFAGLSLLDRALETISVDGPWAAVGLDPLPVPAHRTDIKRWPTAGFEIDTAGGALLLDVGEWGEADFAPLLASFRRHPRPVVVCNPDITAPYTDAMSVEPGYFAHRLADATGIEPLFLGKPYPEVYELALADLGHIPRERVLCVGDTLHTDVLGGRRLGMKSLLVETGFTRGADPLALAAESGIWPDFVAPSI